MIHVSMSVYLLKSPRLTGTMCMLSAARQSVEGLRGKAFSMSIRPSVLCRLLDCDMYCRCILLFCFDVKVEKFTWLGGGGVYRL